MGADEAEQDTKIPAVVLDFWYRPSDVTDSHSRRAISLAATAGMVSIVHRTPSQRRATPGSLLYDPAVTELRLGPLVFVPEMRTQPVAAHDVAAALVDPAEAGPKGRHPDIGGPPGPNS